APGWRSHSTSSSKCLMFSKFISRVSFGPSTGHWKYGESLGRLKGLTRKKRYFFCSGFTGGFIRESSSLSRVVTLSSTEGPSTIYPTFLERRRQQQGGTHCPSASALLRIEETKVLQEKSLSRS